VHPQGASVRSAHWLIVALALSACAPDPQESPQKRNTASPSTSSGSSTSSSTSTSTAATTTPQTTYDCTVAPDPGPFQIDSYDIHTQEDFDFSQSGFLIYQETSANAIVGVDKSNTLSVLSPGAAGDPRGIHGLSDGRIAIMSIWDGTINVADPASGGIFAITTGLDWPNGIDIGANDRLYFSTYGELGWTDIDGGNFQVVHTFGGNENGNGVALAPGETKLTVAVNQNYQDTVFVSLELLGPDDWGNATIDHSINGFFSAIEYDICGNLYTVDYYSGALYRLKPDGVIELLADLGPTGSYSAMRFGPGHSGWERDRLYVSRRSDEVYEVYIGIPGVPHPTTP